MGENNKDLLTILDNKCYISRHNIILPPGEAEKADEPGDEVLHGEEARARRVHPEGAGRIRAGQAAPRKHDGRQGKIGAQHMTSATCLFTPYTG